MTYLTKHRRDRRRPSRRLEFFELETRQLLAPAVYIPPDNRSDGPLIQPPIINSVNGVLKATIDRIVVLGFEVRVELTAASNHTPFTAQITRGDAEALGLKEGDTVYVRATRVPELPGGTDVPKADNADENEALSNA